LIKSKGKNFVAPDSRTSRSKARPAPAPRAPASRERAAPPPAAPLSKSAEWRAAGASQTDRGRESAERILAAGIACFAAKGYSGTTTREVAAAAGANIASLAYHFGGKEGLYRAAIGRLYEQVVALEPALELQGPPEVRIHRLVTLLYGLMRAHASEIRLLMRHVLDTGVLPEPVREAWSVELLDRAASLWRALGLPEDPQWKLKLLTLSQLFARFAISDPRDLVGFVDGDDPQGEVAEHLAWVAERLLLDRPARRARG
jgi:AcrR family transcriptional regulator